MKFSAPYRVMLRGGAVAAIALLALPATAHMSAPPDSVPASQDTTSAAPPDSTAPPADDATVPSATADFSVQPSGKNGPGGRDYFIYTLKPGDTYGDTAAVSNLGDKPVTFAVYATDALNTRDGGFTLLRPDKQPTDVGTWVQLGATQYTLEPGKRVDIPFTVTVPADATPGDHVGAIVAQPFGEGSATPAPGSPSLNVSLRIGARLYLRVDGAINPALSVSKFSIRYDTPANPFAGRRAEIHYIVTNSGNIRLSPTAAVKVTGMLGFGARHVADRQIPELLPGSSLEVAETVRDVRPYGRLTATLHLDSPNDHVSVRRSVDVWTLPWLGVLLLALLAGGAVFLLIRRNGRRHTATARVG